jgi:hypothetical protein
MATVAALPGARRADWFAATWTGRVPKTIEAVMPNPCFCGWQIAAAFVADEEHALGLSSPYQEV